MFAYRDNSSVIRHLKVVSKQKECCCENFSFNRFGGSGGRPACPKRYASYLNRYVCRSCLLRYSS